LEIRGLMLKNKEISMAIILGVSCALLLLGVSYVFVPNDQSHTLGMGNSNWGNEILRAIFGIALITIVSLLAIGVFIIIRKKMKH
jgi:hypothetical protein